MLSVGQKLLVKCWGCCNLASISQSCSPECFPTSSCKWMEQCCIGKEFPMYGKLYSASQNCHDAHIINTIFGYSRLHIVTLQISHAERKHCFWLFAMHLDRWKRKKKKKLSPSITHAQVHVKTIFLFLALIIESSDHPCCGESIPATTSRY